MRIPTRWLWVATAGLFIVASVGTAPPLGAQPADQDQAWLGVYSQSLTPALREGINYRGRGVLISRVIPDSPADQAGISGGDVIVAVGGRAVDTPSELADMIQSRRSDSRVMIRVARDGRIRNVNVRLGARPAHEPESMEWYPTEPDRSDAPKVDEANPDPDVRVYRFDGRDLEMPDFSHLMRMGRGRLGVRVESLNRDLARYFRVSDGKGVLVLEVLKDTPADRAGLQAGDVIREVGRDAVERSEDLVRALRSAEDGRVSLTIVRDGSERVLDAELENPRALRLRDREGSDFSWRMDDRTRDRIRSEVRRGLRETAPEARDDLRRELRELREEMKQLRREIDRLRN